MLVILGQEEPNTSYRCNIAYIYMIEAETDSTFKKRTFIKVEFLLKKRNEIHS